VQLCNNHLIWRNAQQIVGHDHIINAIQELQEDVYANVDEEGNAAQILEELEEDNEVANIFLELGDVNKPMIMDEEKQE
jgi:hypothetical protein